MSRPTVLFVLSGNLSTTPRALKAILAADKTFDVTVLQLCRSSLWRKMDNKLSEKYNIRINSISLGREVFWQWFYSGIQQRVAAQLLRFFPRNSKLIAYAASRDAILLCMAAKRIKDSYLFVSGHSFGALYPAWHFARQRKIPFVFDVEDYHPGELVNHDAESKRRRLLMQKLLPKAAHITYASPLIGAHTLRLIPDFPDNKYTLINNCFPQQEFSFVANDSDKLRFVWFSQNIAPGRGLELILATLYEFRKQVEVRLIGNLYGDFYHEQLPQYKDMLTLYPPMPQTQLHQSLANADVGLAIELRDTNLNRDICLTNKIFAYAQSGLYILATHTQAQNQFINTHADLGIITRYELNDIRNKLQVILRNKEQIRANKPARFEYAKKLSWEHESPKLQAIWSSI